MEKLRQINYEFSIICLQETWLEEGADLSQFHISNYRCVSQGKYCSQHGGLITYVHVTYDFEEISIPIRSNIWECLVLLIRNNGGKYMYISNIYRPPNENLTSALIEKFTDELSSFLLTLNHSNSTVLIYKIIIKDYFNNIIALGLIPYIKLPTRVTDSSATLIDNIFCNNPDIRAGILLSDISDHYPYFCALNIN